MRIPLYQIDAFTSKVFGGNPAAVCPLEEWLPDDVMQSIAAENNLSETAFFVSEGEDFRLRWFTPEIEVDLCGHATLATAHVLFRHLRYRGATIRFHTQSGLLEVSKAGKLLSMNFPARPPLPVEAPKLLVDGLGMTPVEVFKSRDYMAVFRSEEDVRGIRPNFSALDKLTDCLGIIATAPGRDADFVSRFFAPLCSIPEDPVTGSAHSTLIPYWARRLGKTSLYALQVSKRGGELWCEDRGERVTIAGQAVTYSVGAMRL
jgi:PhzF family phenazine biosynthesis protein